MREIKFRMLVTSGDKPWHHWVFPQSIEYCETAFNHYNLESWTQFTGLKDKNGTDIYEGDIVQRDIVSGNLTSPIFTVRWKDTEAGFSLTNRFGDTVKNLKVIGNVYENPELLK